MKLAIVIPGFQADEHDWCIPAFTNLAREMAATVELHVFTLRYPHVRKRYHIGDVRVHALGGGALFGTRLLGASLLKLWRDALSEIRREHHHKAFDAIIGIWATESGWLATRAARMLGVPSLVHLAGGELTWLPQIKYGNYRPGLARLLVAQAIRHADMLSVPSSPLEVALSRLLPNSKGRIKRWALGVDTQMFTPETEAIRASDAPFSFITVGSLIPVKGHDWILRAMASLRRNTPEAEFRLQIVGQGPLLSRLQESVIYHKLKGYVDFLGELPHERLPQLYRSADCFVLSSWHEAQCMAALEAMACGLPWIGPPVGALADVYSASPDGKPGGVLVRERSVGALSEAMLAVMTLSPDEREAWGMEARKIVERDYCLEKQTRRLLDLVIAVGA
ncbi:MAG TPA: glycosyltransferase family 4 protein [Chloroflexia bacterium]|jgi:glycosyltransferase involved in cell wall biosynthesis